MDNNFFENRAHYAYYFLFKYHAFSANYWKFIPNSNNVDLKPIALLIQLNCSNSLYLFPHQHQQLPLHALIFNALGKNKFICYRCKRITVHYSLCKRVFFSRSIIFATIIFIAIK